jgi:hypothetical protein
MTSRRLRVLALAACALSAGALTACGGDDEPAGAASRETTAASTATADGVVDIAAAAST